MKVTTISNCKKLDKVDEALLNLYFAANGEKQIIKEIKNKSALLSEKEKNISGVNEKVLAKIYQLEKEISALEKDNDSLKKMIMLQL